MKSTAPKKHVLVIAGEFPPIKTIGRIRTAKFVQHLQNEGWNPVVLTIETTPSTYDKSLEDEIPTDIPVYRTRKIDLEQLIVSALKPAKYLKNQETPHKDINPQTENNQTTFPPTYKQLVKDKLISNFKNLLKFLIYIPDDYNFWALTSQKTAEKICKEHEISIVYTSLPPFSACILGYRIKTKFDIPWVVDYRDLWFGDVLREWLPTWRQKLELRIEKYFISKADAIISVSEQKTEYLKKLLPKVNTNWLTITNGYDTDIFEPLLAKPRKSNHYLNFVYTGRLFKNRRGYAFAEALGQLCQEMPELINQVRVHILGGVSPEIQHHYNELLTHYQITELYNFTGDISYQEAMEAQINTDYLLLIVDTGATSDGVIPGKLFEYIASRRPIFALTNPGATQEIIEKSRAGVVVPAESVEACKAELKKLLNSDIPDQLDLDEAYLSQFDRKQLTKRLADLFDNLLSQR
jgi:glycosyltransferase involved in cell wall biosynthesis